MKTVEADKLELPEAVRDALARVVNYLLPVEDQDFLECDDRYRDDHLCHHARVLQAYLHRSLGTYEDEERGVCPECGQSDFFLVRDGRVFGVCMFHRLIWRTETTEVEPIDEDENEVRSLLVRDYELVDRAIPAVAMAH